MELEAGINENIASGAVLDEEYWQSLLKRIVVRKNEVRFIVLVDLCQSHTQNY